MRRTPTPYPPRVEAILIGFETGRLIRDTEETEAQRTQEPKATVAEVRAEVQRDLWEDLMGAQVRLPVGTQAVIT